MAAPNMATITASLERSLQNCSLNHHRHNSSSTNSSSGGEGSDRVGIGIGTARSSSSTSSTPDDRPENHQHHHLSNNTDTALELNSHISLPYHWEQCLDLKTGEIYYINWRNGMKAKEDPRTRMEYSGEYYYSEEEQDSSCDSEGSSSESSPPCSTSRSEHYNNRVDQKDHVLVVAGCKSCLMYFMVPKQVEDCPKCNGQLLHFDRSENGSP
ncbi:hypothetical protein FNV43_RR27072 [Rhamnella rubrinervis]|uniref:WW domain-containing protein n=1 Tax=Rhamnella rubrinervis TaxID=2594499 RepID=A0A8K0DJQ6_9ROSA|nr:hypothetical protein FNV43_RR27072 [Rhamnella rubrinervis]